MDRLTYILDISPASGNKSVPIGLAAIEDPPCAVVAQASFWRLGSVSNRWSAMAIDTEIWFGCANPEFRGLPKKVETINKIG